jgi:uncharacterized protein
VVAYAPERILPLLQSGLRAFVGQTAWEDLAKEWVARQGYADELPFVPEAVGGHWSRSVQVDVVAINWQSRSILLGECKWGTDLVGKQTVRELLERKTPLLLADLPDGGKGWSVHHAFFARQGLTPAASEELARHSGIAIDLATLAADLAL